MKEIINDSKFSSWKFSKKSKEKVLKIPIQRFFCFPILALTDLKIKSKNFNIGYIPI